MATATEYGDSTQNAESLFVRVPGSDEPIEVPKGDIPDDEWSRLLEAAKSAGVDPSVGTPTVTLSASAPEVVGHRGSPDENDIDQLVANARAAGTSPEVSTARGAEVAFPSPEVVGRGGEYADVVAPNGESVRIARTPDMTEQEWARIRMMQKPVPGPAAEDIPLARLGRLATESSRPLTSEEARQLGEVPRLSAESSRPLTLDEAQQVGDIQPGGGGGTLGSLVRRQIMPTTMTAAPGNPSLERFRNGTAAPGELTGAPETAAPGYTNAELDAPAPPAQPPAAIDPSKLVVAPPQSIDTSLAAGVRQGSGLGPSATDALMPEIRRNADNAAAAYEAVGRAESAKLEAQGRAAQSAVSVATDAAVRMQDLQQRRSAEQDALMGPIKETANQLGQIQQIDPNRLWNGMSTGNKVLAAASILLGGMGQGTFAALGIKHDNEALGMINDAIKQDVEVQHQNITNRREALTAKLAGQRTVFQMLRDKGLDEFESLKAETGLKFEAAAKQVEQIGLQMGAPEALAKARAAAMALRQESQKYLLEAAQHRDKYALGRANLDYKWAALAQRERAIKAQQLKAGEVDKDADIRSAVMQLQDLQQRYAKTVPGLGKLAKGISGTDSNDYENSRNAVFEAVAPLMKGGVLRPGDRESLDTLVPHAGSFKGDATSKFQAALRLLYQRYTERQHGLAAAGYQAGALPDLPAADEFGFEE